jgi:hypothetical protein
MALRLDDIASAAPDQIELVLAIAGHPITLTDDQRHTGFVVRGNDGKLWQLHQAWHNRFFCEEAQPEYAYTSPACLDEYAAAPIIGFLFALHDDTSGRIPYSIAYQPVNYFVDGRYVQTAPGQGLTCATFVLEVLRHHGIDIINRDTWPPTVNAAWQQRTVSHFAPTSEHFLAQCAAIGKVARFTPEQVVGAAYYFADTRVTYSEAEAAAKEVVDELVQMYKDWPPELVLQWFPTGAQSPWPPP